MYYVHQFSLREAQVVSDSLQPKMNAAAHQASPLHNSSNNTLIIYPPSINNNSNPYDALFDLQRDSMDH